MIRYRPNAVRPLTRRLPRTLGLGAVGLLAGLSLATRRWPTRPRTSCASRPMPP